VKPRGTLKVVDMRIPTGSARLQYAEPLVTLDKDNKWAPCLAVDWRWANKRTMEFRLRKGVNYAINREELLRYCAKGNAYNLGGYLPQDELRRNPNLTLYSYDTTKARSLLTEAGYPDGFVMKIVAGEAWQLEGQIIAKMLERIGLKANLHVLPQPQLMKKIYVPILDEPPEEQDWDVALYYQEDWYGHPGTNFLMYGLLEESNQRWVSYDSLYEEKWSNMARMNERDVQEERIRELVAYVYERAYYLFIYSPLTLYAVNKDVDFVPQRFTGLRLKETSVAENHWSVRGKNY
jgi:ABC-type transport system substrate-binding protein